MNSYFDQLSFWTSQHFLALIFLVYCFFLGFVTTLKFNLWQFDFDINIIPKAEKNKNKQKLKSDVCDIFSISGSAGNIYTQLFFSICVGLGIVITSLFILGLFNGFQKMTVLGMMLFWLLIAVAVVVFDSNIQSRFKQIKQKWCFCLASFFEVVAVLLILLAVMFSYIKTLGMWDDTSFHLPLAASYAKQGGFVLNEHLRFPLIPQNINLLFVWALIFGDHVLAQAMATLPLFVICLGLLGLSVWVTRSTWIGFIASLIFLQSGSVLYSLGYAYIDNGFALFCFAVVFAVMIAYQHNSFVWILIAGFLAGITLGIKYFALPLLGLIGLWLMWKRQWRFLVWFSVFTLLFGSAWYIRSFIISGDPIHPMGAKLFGYFLWNANDLQGVSADIARLGVASSPWLFLSALFHINSWPLVLAFIPIFFVLKLKPFARFTLLIWCGYFIFWFFFAQVQRYLAPVLAIGSFLAAYSIYLCFAKLFGQSYEQLQKDIPKFFAGLFGFLMACFLAHFFYKDMIIHTTYNQEILKSRSDAGYELYQHANTLRSKLGDRVLQLHFEQGIYFFDGTVIGDAFGLGRYSQFEKNQNGRCELIPAEQMKEVMEKFSTRMLMVSYRCGFPGINNYPTYFKLEKKTNSGLLLSLLNEKT